MIVYTIKTVFVIEKTGFCPAAPDADVVQVAEGDKNTVGAVSFLPGATSVFLVAVSVARLIFRVAVKIIHSRAADGPALTRWWR